MGAYHPVGEWALADRSEFDRQTAELTRIGVDPAHHREGYGQAIYEELEYRARSDGYLQIVLDTGVKNEVARTFYESLEFTFVDEHTLAGFGETFDLAVYRKSLLGCELLRRGEILAVISIDDRVNETSFDSG